MERGECIGINRGLPTMIWDMLGRRIQAREPPLQNIRQLEAALHREWQQLSQQDIRRLTGGMRCRVEAVIQARRGYTRYWTLNNRCRQVIHSWRFESEMTILSCFLSMIFVVSYSQCNVLTGHHCVPEIIWSVISWYLSYHLSFQKNMGCLSVFFVYIMWQNGMVKPYGYC